ncbi:MAG: endonuclease/exonuclease/phosphatase family protein [Chloroflexi bacterium]|nr:endonuclease/exonuclease/phosphatase family protein [Chloroflexota bacterium]
MPLTVLSYNIRQGGTGRLAEIAAVIRKRQPDAIALLEAGVRAHAETLAHAFDMALVYGEGNSHHHLAWLSRLPISRSANHRSAGLAKTLLEIEVMVDGAPLSLFATHLGSRWDTLRPADEIPVLLDVLRRLDGRPHLLVGDFNALRAGDPVGIRPAGLDDRPSVIDRAPRLAIDQIVRAGYVDCYRALHPTDPGLTYPTSAPWLRLDYVFIPEPMVHRVAACGVVTSELARRASDHFPLWATLA